MSGENSGEQYEASTNGNDFTSLLKVNDQVIVVDPVDPVDKKAYKMTIADFTTTSIKFVEFLNEISNTKDFYLQLVNEYELEVVDGVTRTKTPVKMDTSSSDVSVCYIRQPADRNSWYALENGFHVLAVESVGVENVMEPTRTLVAVKDQPVTIQFRGIGLRYADGVYFVEMGSVCNMNSSLFSMTWTYTFGTFTFSEAKQYEVCYMYGSTITAENVNEVFRKVPGLSVFCKLCRLC